MLTFVDNSKIKDSSIYGHRLDGTETMETLVVAAYYMGFAEGQDDYEHGLRGL